ncbi:hypothetical protein ACIBQ1_17920 [Nonomuraea sp. NPDC050153]|uniref:hypothetical protein n=1 Tax=Nonomuraea sp. NPDC050153 TaxID=3364359 RepID=UPI00378849A4
MKRILAGLALTTAAALVTVTPAAQAAPVDAVKALKKQFVAGHGVRISEETRTSLDGKSLGTTKTSGTFEFGKSGVVASDLRTRTPSSDKSLSASLAPPRIITVGGYSYIQGGLYSEDLPEGKKWVRYGGSEATGGTFNQILDIFEPKVLKTLVSKAKSFKGGTYKGVLTYSELGKVYGQKVTGLVGKIKIDYTLKVNSKGLVTTLSSGWSMDFGVLGKTRSVTETRYLGWGSKVKVKAPAEDQWIDVKDLSEDSDVPQEIPNNSLNSLAN